MTVDTTNDILPLLFRYDIINVLGSEIEPKIFRLKITPDNSNMYYEILMD